MPVDSPSVTVPHEPLGRLFLRFLRFGLLAWGGPVVQIAMLRDALVDRERWVTSDHFNRVLGLYQVLPGPEAHELCVYFGMLSRGRVGGVLAGLGFMLPGFILMLALSWLYVSAGLLSDEWAAVFAAVQAAVAAVIARAVHRIGSHVVTNGWLWAVALLAAAAHLMGVHFAWILVVGGLSYLAVHGGFRVVAGAALAVALLALLALAVGGGLSETVVVAGVSGEPHTQNAVSLARLFWAGLKAGALTFGGAYTVIPFLQEDAVVNGAWLSNAQFLDGVALGSLLPAPLIIFATFVGYLGGGAAGAFILTIGIFLPAFALTLIGHRPMESFLHRPLVRPFLDGVTAAVVGLIAGTALGLLPVTVVDLPTGAVFVLALIAAFAFRSKFVVPAIVAAAIAWGLALTAFTT